MNVLGLFLASALRRNLVERDKRCTLRGSLTIDAGGMRATVRFEEDGATVTRQPAAGGVEVSAPLPALVGAVARPGLGLLFKVRMTRRTGQAREIVGQDRALGRLSEVRERR